MEITQTASHDRMTTAEVHRSLEPPQARTSPVAAQQQGDASPVIEGGVARHAGHPLGPLVRMVPLDRPIVSRLYAAGVAAAAIAVLAAAAIIAPHGAHMGTHAQLGLPPCGFVVMTGLPCPTCGMTTAFAYTVHGQFLEAIRSQVAGFLMAVMTAAVGMAGLVALVTGRRPSINWYRINPVRVVWVGAVVIVAAWALKIAVGLLNGTLPVR